ncbi:maleylpyruvate isomerase [Nocardioides sp. YR527]|uniref:maleylpyruvate isomerase family mycothiol-dependent enzyme n=1 Tax=Nocardioides sp. YR527 TaxID=1881028 RepID=UPI00088A50A3|nr:maleylpyruvate isomerase family mycothiol-dependent enzyme [Nocardioides sp. YR527]SDK23628.1 maleylpyruvate isomerase [Nocardioides sp. YR527]
MSVLIGTTPTRTFDDARRWVAEGTALLTGGVDGLSVADFDADSLLPGWTRKHLVGHVAANADALGNLLSWAETGVEKRMYASPEQRNADIEAAATRPAEELRAWYLRGLGELEAAMNRLSPEQWDHEVITAQLVTRKASDVPWMRAREVFVHAVDLGVGITFADLPDDFLLALAGEIRAKRGLTDDDLRGVTGPLPEVAAWLAGRPHGLVDAPELGPWL